MTDQTTVAGAARTFADDLAESASTIIRNAELSDIPNLMGEVEAFARRNPLAFAALAVGAGFLATRAMNASEKRRSQMEFEGAGGRQDMSSMPATRDEIPRTVAALERERATPDVSAHRD